MVSVPLAFRETAEGDETHEGDDEAEPETPDNGNDDADYDQDAADANASRSIVLRHGALPFREAGTLRR
jgi:hypothetical protein